MAHCLRLVALGLPESELVDHPVTGLGEPSDLDLDRSGRGGTCRSPSPTAMSPLLTRSRSSRTCMPMTHAVAMSTLLSLVFLGGAALVARTLSVSRTTSSEAPVAAANAPPASGDRELQPDGADPVPKRTTSPPEAMIARPVATSSAPTPRQRRSPVGRGPEEADFARARVIEPTRMSHVQSPHRSRSSTHAGESEDNSGRTLDPKALTETPSQRIRQEVVTTRR